MAMAAPSRWIDLRIRRVPAPAPVLSDLPALHLAARGQAPCRRGTDSGAAVRAGGGVARDGGGAPEARSARVRPSWWTAGRRASWCHSFMVELVGTKVVDSEAPPRILHSNPRIRGDYSDKPVIEMNSCYRMQWARSQRCEGFASRPAEETGESSSRFACLLIRLA
ncbi:putative beta-1,3-galactosyltransferase 18 [Hordeum vulgare]|nr:putative beta-1,3-galactosyltransferase 18 [Hordeum vulgare]